MGEPEIRNLRLDDIVAFYGQRLRKTVQGWSVYLDGELVAICGVRFEAGVMLAFSDIKPDVVVPKITIWRTAVKLWENIQSLNLSTLYAVASPKIPGAPAFLERLGFEHIESSVRGEVFKWQIQSQSG